MVVGFPPIAAGLDSVGPQWREELKDDPLNGSVPGNPEFYLSAQKGAADGTKLNVLRWGVILDNPGEP